MVRHGTLDPILLVRFQHRLPGRKPKYIIPRSGNVQKLRRPPTRCGRIWTGCPKAGRAGSSIRNCAGSSPAPFTMAKAQTIQTREGDSMEEHAVEYWPFAMYRKPDGTKDSLWTYDSVNSWDGALDVIRRWADDCNYHLTEANVKICAVGRPNLNTWRRVF